MKHLTILLVLALFLVGCGGDAVPESASGVKKIEASITTGADGMTAEQRNIRGRLLEDNKPGAIKHLYVVSAYSGQVILYSTVKGKITSGGKRLTPTTVSAMLGGIGTIWKGDLVDIGDTRYVTQEMIQDDGTFGSSMNYLYWWDTKDIYHQHYVSGGQIIHISSQPISVKGIIINLEVSQIQTDK